MTTRAELLQLALSYHQSGSLEQAERIYKQLLVADPYDTNILHLYSILAAQSGHYDQALTLMLQALELEPNSSTFHNSIGNILRHLQRYDEAIAHYETSIKLHPAAPVAHNNLANLYANRKQYDQAILHYQQAIALKADYQDAYYNLAIALTHLDRLDAAIENLQQAIMLQPDFVQAHWQLALLLQQTDQFETALSHYHEVLALSPHYLEAYVNIGAIWVKQGELFKGIEYFEKALTLDPHHHEAHYNLGSTYLSLQMPDEALKHYFQCLLHRPDADTYFNIGAIYMYKDRYSDAIEHFNAALSIRPDYFEVHVNLGTTFLKIENYANALTHYQRALQIQPANTEIQYIISAISEQKNAPNKAPIDFVKHLFDQYAPYFETHLISCLNYQAHTWLFQSVVPFLANTQKLTIVDLGCGTGLCGALFKQYAANLIGIDIAAKIIDIARQKKIYDVLIVDELTHALTQLQDIDLILAADVFGYIGDLSEVFSAAYLSLKTDGLFAFTVEKSTSKAYALAKSTRFVHSKDYIRDLCTHYPFVILHHDEVQLRIQRGIPVLGYLFILRKTDALT